MGVNTHYRYLLSPIGCRWAALSHGLASARRYLCDRQTLQIDAVCDGLRKDLRNTWLDLEQGKMGRSHKERSLLVAEHDTVHNCKLPSFAVRRGFCLDAV